MNMKQGERPAGNDPADKTLHPGVALAMLDLAEHYWREREHARENSVAHRDDIAA